MRYPLSLLILTTLVLSGSCKKDVPPEIRLKSGGSYTTTDIIASPGSQFTVGIDATKTADDLNLFYTEAAFDGANTAMLISRTWIAEGKRSHYTQDVTITLRNQSGTERWIFNVNDSEGRISRKEIRVTVQ
jgi:hypothetical protein